MAKSTKRARILRKKSTPAERLLWSRLRDRQPCVFKFRRQHCLGTRIVDFFCVEGGLAVELDGSGHAFASGRTRDELRAVELARAGIREMRFWNDEVIQNTDGVLDAILYRLDPAKSRWPESPSP